MSDSIATCFVFLSVEELFILSSKCKQILYVYAKASRTQRGTLQLFLLSHASSVSLTVLDYFCQHIHMVFIFYFKKKDLIWSHISLELLFCFCFSAPFYSKIPQKSSFDYLRFLFPFSLLNSLQLGFHTHHPPKQLLSKSPVTSMLLNPAVSSQSLSSSWTCLQGLAVGFLSSRNIYSLSFSLDSPLTWLLILFSIICCPLRPPSY